MKILVLGHKGMLGRTLMCYFNSIGYELGSLDGRWPSEEFKQDIISTKADYIINCIGAIPQKKPTDEEYKTLNVELPRFLETLNVRVIHPSTDCEFKGDIPVGQVYLKESWRDADDVYGKSKADISTEIEDKYTNTKIIRTSIIGHEDKTHVSLLEWFLSQSTEARGYTNHYWNGVTTLQWAKLAEYTIKNWDNLPKLNQYSVTPLSKYELLNVIARVYQRNTKITAIETEVTVNKCLSSDMTLPVIEQQLIELKYFFKK